MFTGSNGIKVLFRAPGYLVPGNRWGPGFYGRYWSSTPEGVYYDEGENRDVYYAYFLDFDFSVDDGLYLRGMEYYKTCASYKYE